MFVAGDLGIGLGDAGRDGLHGATKDRRLGQLNATLAFLFFAEFLVALVGARLAGIQSSMMLLGHGAAPQSIATEMFQARVVGLQTQLRRVGGIEVDNAAGRGGVQGALGAGRRVVGRALGQNSETETKLHKEIY